MTTEEFVEILKDDEKDTDLLMTSADNAFDGLIVIRKYIPGCLITGAGHEVIYSVRVEEIVKAGITEEDARILARLNWGLTEDDYRLKCFV